MPSAVTQWSLAAPRCLFKMGSRYGRRDGYAWSVWIFGRYDDLVFLQQFLWIVSTDPIGVWGEYVNPLTAWFLGVAHYMDGPSWFQSLVGDVSTTELLCVAHWNVWRHLQSSRWFAAYPLPFLCRRWWGPSKSFFVAMKFSAMSSSKVITDAQMRGLIKHHKWKCPILSQFHKGSVIHVWLFIWPRT